MSHGCNNDIQRPLVQLKFMEGCCRETSQGAKAGWGSRLAWSMPVCGRRRPAALCARGVRATTALGIITSITVMKLAHAFRNARILTAVALVCAPLGALAQKAGPESAGYGPTGSAAQPTRDVGNRGAKGRESTAAHTATPAALRDGAKLQRLDPGALVCPTEADLQQHEAAVEARLDGHDAAEPPSCRFVHAPIAVTVIDRHGPAATEVQMPGQAGQLGWTDAVVRDAVRK